MEALRRRTSVGSPLGHAAPPATAASKTPIPTMTEWTDTDAIIRLQPVGPGHSSPALPAAYSACASGSGREERAREGSFALAAPAAFDGVGAVEWLLDSAAPGFDGAGIAPAEFSELRAIVQPFCCLRTCGSDGWRIIFN